MKNCCLEVRAFLPMTGSPQNDPCELPSEERLTKRRFPCVCLLAFLHLGWLVESSVAWSGYPAAWKESNYGSMKSFHVPFDVGRSQQPVDARLPGPAWRRCSRCRMENTLHLVQADASAPGNAREMLTLDSLGRMFCRPGDRPLLAATLPRPPPKSHGLVC
ncbi:hypothetical protein Naga_100094g11 [Nannochloropsis gaditana]|uniref:Uncharacterized protein n=1 Tax=Nannochloropsis gaditana TaxID=72520 RepID=W7TP65_9STRA|nr:hypothetical protein Naga_100094g11 [Nannochloropsis gaditana]